MAITENQALIWHVVQKIIIEISVSEYVTIAINLKKYMLFFYQFSYLNIYNKIIKPCRINNIHKQHNNYMKLLSVS